MKKQPFNKQLRAWREKLGVSQKRAAELLEVNRRTYEAWEQGANEPSSYAMGAILGRMEGAKKLSEVES